MEEKKARDQKKAKRSRAGTPYKHSGGFFARGRHEDQGKTEVEPGSLAQGEILNRLVYGPPIEAKVQPSVGTQDTPPRTDLVLPIDPDGWTKQGEGKAPSKDEESHESP